MIISNDYLKSLAGFKITLLESNLTEFKILKTKPIGITEDKFIIYGNKTEKKRRKRSKKKPKVETN